MPVFNVTIPDSSPLIVYSGSWDDTPKATTDYQLYQNQTYHLSSQSGDTATLAFNGSGIYIFGARKPEYNSYSVLLDDSSLVYDSATAAAAQYNSLLYSATSLDATKEHRVVLQNSQGSSQGTSLDIDYVIITAGDGNTQTTSQEVWWNQDNSNISYSAHWVPLSGPNYTSGNAQLARTPGATATVTFEGNAIALYGTTNDNHGLFGVSIDDGPQATFNGSAPEPRFQMLLYYANGLPSGQHTLRLIDASPSGSPINALELDTVSVSSWTDPLSNPTTPSVSSSTAGADGTSPTATDTSPSHHVSTGKIIAGSVVAVVLGVVLVGLGAFLLYRRRNVRRRDVGERHNILLEDRSGADPFYTPSAGTGMQQMSGGSAFVPAAPGSTSTYTVTSGRQSLSHTAPQVSSMTIVSASGTTFLEKQRLAQLDAASSGRSAPSPTVAGLSYNESENPHQDFPPPGYCQVFPTSHTP